MKMTVGTHGSDLLELSDEDMSLLRIGKTLQAMGMNIKRQVIEPVATDRRNKPLDEEWIANCWRKSLLGTRISYVEYRNFVREVERAHDIKEN